MRIFKAGKEKFKRGSTPRDEGLETDEGPMDFSFATASNQSNVNISESSDEEDHIP